MAALALELGELLGAAAAAAEVEAVTVESEAGLEATIKTGEEAVETAEKAAELKVGLGARISKAVEGTIVDGLKGALKQLKGLSSKAGDALLLKMAIDQVPAEQRGSKEGKNIAKLAKEVAKELNENARKLKVDTPSKLPINKETHEAEMKKIKQQADSDKQHMMKITGILDEMNQLMKEHEGDKPHEEGEEENN
uniref:Uncharacterized protein n=1 Tax=Tanacetum cinerariifolium TaxID=118510 RepID=A0A6L2MK49_TANCI|nr:hypothetical protein [Tanacetum cinerariifolium]